MDQTAPPAPGGQAPEGAAQPRFPSPSAVLRTNSPARELERSLIDPLTQPEMHWSVPWADLMMTMFVFFAVLFIYASAHRDVMEAFRGHKAYENVQPQYLAMGARSGPMPVHDRPSAGRLPTMGAQQLQEAMNAAVRDEGLKDVTVRTEGDLVRITMHGPLLFDQFSAELKPEGRRFLGAVARILARMSNLVEVHGHTDNTPVATQKYPTAWELSAARAVNVARTLVESENLEPARVSVVGHAMNQPAAPNLTVESKTRNRRVEIVVRRPEPAPGD